MRRRASSGVERSPGARIGRGVVLAAPGGGRIVLGASAVLGDRCELRAAPGAVIIVHGRLDERCRLVAHAAITVEAGARVGPGCMLCDLGPVFDDPERPVRRQGVRAAPVRVAADALLGPGVAVLRGVTVGAGATVLANSVCTRDVPPGTPVGGIPAHRPGSPPAASVQRSVTRE